MKYLRTLSPHAVCAIGLNVGIANQASAATIDSSSFGAASASLNLDGYDDWGYVSGGLFGDGNLTDTAYTYDGTGVTNRKDSGAYGTATLTENGTIGTKGTSDFDVTFTTGLNPVSDTNLAFGGGFGNHRVEELFTYSFQDVGAGTHTIDMYFGSSSRFNGTMEFTTNITAADDNVVNFVESGVWPGSAFTWKYSITFTTTDPNADISVFWNNTGSPDGGEASTGLWTATVVPVPEPGSLALIALGGLMIARRRRA